MQGVYFPVLCVSLAVALSSTYAHEQATSNNKGSFLIAAQSIGDPRFSQSVVALVPHLNAGGGVDLEHLQRPPTPGAAQGAATAGHMGIVLNKPEAPKEPTQYVLKVSPEARTAPGSEHLEEGTVVFIMEPDEEGGAGAGAKTLGEVVAARGGDVGELEENGWGGLAVYNGGPVQRDLILALAYLQRPLVSPTMHNVFGNVYLLNYDELVRSLHKNKTAEVPLEGLRIFSGYAGWAPGQLENEIQRGDWQAIQADESVIFARPLGTLWTDLVQFSFI
ncbi:putative transcriptional regulator [Pelomyxa schiedti]|nr:putative transcriptional regulator [Pelomyxa schiedti]